MSRENAAERQVAKALRAVADLEKRRRTMEQSIGLCPRAGDVYRSASVDKPGVSWLVVRELPGKDAVQAFPVDDHALVGSHDLQLDSKTLGGVATVRCSIPAWVDLSELTPDRCVGVLNRYDLGRVRRRRLAVCEGSLESSDIEVHVDLDPMYRSWIKELQECCQAVPEELLAGEHDLCEIEPVGARHPLVGRFLCADGVRIDQRYRWAVYMRPLTDLVVLFMTFVLSYVVASESSVEMVGGRSIMSILGIRIVDGIFNLFTHYEVLLQAAVLSVATLFALAVCKSYAKPWRWFDVRDLAVLSISILSATIAGAGALFIIGRQPTLPVLVTGLLFAYVTLAVLRGARRLVYLSNSRIEDWRERGRVNSPIQFAKRVVIMAPGMHNEDIDVARINTIEPLGDFCRIRVDRSDYLIGKSYKEIYGLFDPDQFLETEEGLLGVALVKQPNRERKSIQTVNGLEYRASLDQILRVEQEFGDYSGVDQI